MAILESALLTVSWFDQLFVGLFPFYKHQNFRSKFVATGLEIALTRHAFRVQISRDERVARDTTDPLQRCAFREQTRRTESDTTSFCESAPRRPV